MLPLIFVMSKGVILQHIQCLGIIDICNDEERESQHKERKDLREREKKQT